MSKRLPNLKAGDHFIKIASWKFKQNGELQITHVSLVSGFRPVWRTFKSTEEALEYIGALTGKQVPQLDSEFLNELIGVTFKAAIKPGKNHFMNLTRVLEVLQGPIFNIPNPVIDCSSAVTSETEKGGQDARQTSLNLP